VAKKTFMESIEELVMGAPAPIPIKKKAKKSKAIKKEAAKKTKAAKVKKTKKSQKKTKARR
jgi:hypothetical protein